FIRTIFESYGTSLRRISVRVLDVSHQDQFLAENRQATHWNEYAALRSTSSSRTGGSCGGTQEAQTWRATFDPKADQLTQCGGSSQIFCRSSYNRDPHHDRACKVHRM